VPPGLGEILAESGDLTLRRLRRASDWRRAHGGTIERALLATGAVSEETLLEALERLTGLPSVSRERLASASRDAVGTLPPETRRRLRALPFDRRGDILHVAVVDPGNPVLETGLVACTGCDVRLHVTAEPILDDALTSWAESARAAEAVPPAGSAAGPPPSPPEAREPLGPAAGPEPFARLARALLVDALDEGAQAVEIGPEGRGTILRTFSGGLALSSRPLPQAVLAPLLAWILARSRPAGPFEEGGFVIERSGRRVRVEVTTDASGTAWLVLEPLATARGGAGETEICLHEGADGDVFCPACGTAL
jgi:hypothetical protein